MFDDDSTWDGLSGSGAFVTLAGWGVVGWLMFALGNQQGIEAASKCAAEVGCSVKAKTGMFGVEYKAIEHSPSVAASSAAK